MVCEDNNSPSFTVLEIACFVHEEYISYWTMQCKWGTNILGHASALKTFCEKIITNVWTAHRMRWHCPFFTVIPNYLPQEMGIYNFNVLETVDCIIANRNPNIQIEYFLQESHSSSVECKCNMCRRQKLQWIFVITCLKSLVNFWSIVPILDKIIELVD